MDVHSFLFVGIYFESKAILLFEFRTHRMPPIQHRVERRVVIHLHLFIYLHVFAPGVDVGQQLVDGGREVFLLLQERGQFLFAARFVGGRRVGAVHLLFHVVNLEAEDREAVDGPGRAFGIDCRIGQRLHLFVFIQEETVDQLYEVGAVLVRLVEGL